MHKYTPCVSEDSLPTNGMVKSVHTKGPQLWGLT